MSVSKYIDQYVVIQFIILLAIFLSTPYLRINQSVIGYVIGGLFMIVGICILIVSIKQLGKALTPSITPKDNAQLVTTGIYHLVRHPMYFGGLTLFVGWSIFWGSLLALLFTIFLAVFFAFKASKEETLLKIQYKEYDDYQAHVTKKIIPFIY